MVHRRAHMLFPSSNSPLYSARILVGYSSNTFVQDGWSRDVVASRRESWRSSRIREGAPLRQRLALPDTRSVLPPPAWRLRSVPSCLTDAQDLCLLVWSRSPASRRADERSNARLVVFVICAAPQTSLVDAMALKQKMPRNPCHGRDIPTVSEKSCNKCRKYDSNKSCGNGRARAVWAEQLPPNTYSLYPHVVPIVWRQTCWPVGRLASAPAQIPAWCRSKEERPGPGNEHDPQDG